MSDETKSGDGVAPTNDGVKSSDGKVSYESFQRALDEKKRVQEKLQSLESELEKAKLNELDKESNLEKQLEAYKAKVGELTDENKGLKTTFATTQINQNIERELAKRGCKEPKKALKVMDDKDYEALITQVDDSFFVEPQTLDLVLGKFQKENDFFFKKDAPKLVDGVPVTTAPKTRDINKLSKDDIISKLKQL